ncbi:MAG: MerR family transcriptional regulator [Bacteroidota bacterium]|nr:MerR family transcriptional regulator [Bacteroidota bacterium]
MGIYSISDLAELTGVKTHTLRVWEKRYGLLTPQRTNSNIRFYEDKDLRTLKLIQKLNANGVRISQIAGMTAEEMEGECSRISKIHDANELKLEAAIQQLDVTTMSSVLDESIVEHGFEATLVNLIMPLLGEMELKFLSGDIDDAHEACFHELIKRKTIREIDAIPQNCSGPKVIMFLPEGNQQELNHHFLHYFLRQQGLCITDIGCDKNMDCVCSALKQRAFECIIVVNEDPAHWQFESYIQKLAEKTSVPIIVSGRASDDHWAKDNTQIIIIYNIAETVRFVSRLRENLQHHLS